MLIEAIFEIVDCVLMHSPATPNSSVVNEELRRIFLENSNGKKRESVELQDYADAMRQLVQDIVVVAPPQKTQPATTAAVPQSPRGSAEPSASPSLSSSPHGLRGFAKAMTGGGGSSPPPGRGGVLSAPQQARGVLGLLASRRQTTMQTTHSGSPLPVRRGAASSVAQRSSAERSPAECPLSESFSRRSPSRDHAREYVRRFQLKETWPAMEVHRVEVMRKLSIIGSAIRERQEVSSISKATAAVEFKAYCRTVAAISDNVRKGDGVLTYSQLYRAFTEMKGENYDALTFRHNVMGRPTASMRGDPSLSTPPSVALADAAATDVEQMLSFMRLLDDEDDGHVTVESFCKALRTGSSTWARLRESSTELVEQMQAAETVAEERLVTTDEQRMANGGASVDT